MHHSCTRRFFRHGMLPQLLVFEAIIFEAIVQLFTDTQPIDLLTVSAQLKKLTDVVGSPLVQQVGHRLLLTDSGRALQRSCQELIELLQRTEHRLALVNTPDYGLVNLSATPTGSLFLDPLLADFCRAHPRVRVRLEIANRQRMQGRSRELTDDLQILCEPGPAIEAQAIRLGSAAYQLYVPIGHRWVGADRITLDDLVQEPMILRESGSDTRAVVEQLFAGPSQPIARLELDSNEAVIRALVDGLGVAVLADRVVTRAQVASKVVPVAVEAFPVRRRWFLCAPAGPTPNAAASLFRQFTAQRLAG